MQYDIFFNTFYLFWHMSLYYITWSNFDPFSLLLTFLQYITTQFLPQFLLYIVFYLEHNLLYQIQLGIKQIFNKSNIKLFIKSNLFSRQLLCHWSYNRKYRCTYHIADTLTNSSLAFNKSVLGAIDAMDRFVLNKSIASITPNTTHPHESTFVKFPTCYFKP